MIAGAIVILLLFAIVIVLICGVVLMGIGGKANAKYGHKLMVARVSLQALVMFMLAAMFVSGKK